MRDLPFGLHEGISHDEYFSDPCVRPSLSSSIAGVIADESPLHAWALHPRLGGQSRPGTASTERGSILHKLLLGRGQEIIPVEARDWRTDKAKAQREAIRADDKIPVLADAFRDYERVTEILRVRIADHGIVFSRNNTELTMVWESDGVLCRGRLDHFDRETFVIDDLKTCETAAPKKIRASMVNFGADVQHAAYTEGVGCVFPEAVGRVTMRYVFVEVEFPYDVVVAFPEGSMRELGERKWKRAKERWGPCLAAGTEISNWPGYSLTPVGIEAPAWALTQDMDDQINNMENSNASAPF